MNIFYLHPDPKTCAQMHNDKHTVKMIIEYAQLMSTAHRLLDGTPYLDKTANGRSIKRWRLEEPLESSLMKASHINHPSAVWTRASVNNYNWLVALWEQLCVEYTHRYGKIHAVQKRLANVIHKAPLNIPHTYFTTPTPAMPDIYKVKGDSLTSYHNYYRGGKQHLASWKNREVPSWFNTQNA
jgi:hypothetical protein